MLAVALEQVQGAADGGERNAKVVRQSVEEVGPDARGAG
jgi:hypothetical protein